MMSQAVGGSAIDALIPHRGRMQLVDSVGEISYLPTRGAAAAKLRADAPYFSALGFEQHWFIELCAQASAAVYQAAKRGVEEGETAARGFLISVRDFEMIESPRLKPGDDLIFRAVFLATEAPLGQSTCEVECGGVLIGKGTLSFLIGDDP